MISPVFSRAIFTCVFRNFCATIRKTQLIERNRRRPGRTGGCADAKDTRPDAGGRGKISYDRGGGPDCRRRFPAARTAWCFSAPLAAAGFDPSRFEVAALTADPQFHGEPADYSQIEELCRRLDVPYHIRRTQLGRIIFEDRKEANPCSLCARMRRGILHNMAKEAGCNKLAWAIITTTRWRPSS